MKNTVWSGIGTSLLLSCLRSGGQVAAADLLRESSRRTAQAFLDKLPEPQAAPGPALAAATRLALDHHLGVPTRTWRDAEGRHWLGSDGPHWGGTGPNAPSMCPAVWSPTVGEARWQGGHAPLAAWLGARDTVFVATHDLTRGDPFDRCCFCAADVAPAVGEGDALPPVGPLEAAMAPGFGEGLPVEVCLRMLVLCEQHGVVGGAAQVEHAWRTLLTAFWQWLPQALGLSGVCGPGGAAAFYVGFWALLGDELAVRHEEGRSIVEHRRHGLWQGQAAVPVPLLEAIVRAWSSALVHCDFHLRCRITDVCVSSGVHLTLCFDAGGPE